MAKAEKAKGQEAGTEEAKGQEIESQEESSREEGLSIEEMFDALQEIIGKLEDGSISLEDSFQYYEEGMKLVRLCGGKIDRVEKQIMVLNENGGEYGA